MTGSADRPDPHASTSGEPLAEHDPREMLEAPQAPPLARASEGIDPSVVRWSRQPKAGDSVVLLLHGVGADEKDLMALVDFLPNEFVYASLRGIFSYGPGYAWLGFPLDRTARETISVSAAAVEAFVDAVAEAGAKVVGVIGFSQGAMLTYELLRRRPDAYQFIAPLSGVPIPGESVGDDTLAATLPGERVPAFWGCGGSDPFFPGDDLDYVRQWMNAHTDVTEVISPAMAHGIDQRILQGLAAFLQEQAR